MVAGLVITLIDSSMCGTWLWALVTGKKSTTHTLVEIQLVRPWESSCIFSFHRSDNVESAGVFVLAILGECVWRVRGLLCPIASLLCPAQIGILWSHNPLWFPASVRTSPCLSSEVFCRGNATLWSPALPLSEPYLQGLILHFRAGSMRHAAEEFPCSQ